MHVAKGSNVAPGKSRAGFMNRAGAVDEAPKDDVMIE